MITKFEQFVNENYKILEYLDDPMFDLDEMPEYAVRQYDGTIDGMIGDVSNMTFNDYITKITTNDEVSEKDKKEILDELDFEIGDMTFGEYAKKYIKDSEGKDVEKNRTEFIEKIVKKIRTKLREYFRQSIDKHYKNNWEKNQTKVLKNLRGETNLPLKKFGGKKFVVQKEKDFIKSPEYYKDLK